MKIMKAISNFCLIRLIIPLFILMPGCSPVTQIQMNTSLRDKYHFTATDSVKLVYDAIGAKSYGATLIGEILSLRKRGWRLKKKIAKLGGDLYDVDYERVTSINMPFMELTDIHSEKTYNKVTTTYTYSMKDHNIKAYPIYIYRIIPELKQSVLSEGFKSCLKGTAYCTKLYDGCDFCYPEVLKNYINNGLNAGMKSNDSIPFIYYFIDYIAIITSKGIDDAEGDEWYLNMDNKKLEMLLEQEIDLNYTPEEFEYDENKPYLTPLPLKSKPYPSILKIVRDGIKSANEGIKTCSKDTLDNAENYRNYLLKVEKLLIAHGAREFETE